MGRDAERPENVPTQSMGTRGNPDYIHRNPVKRGYVDSPEHWRYSSAWNYLGVPGLIGIDLWS
jgi:hypothetical protein